MTQEDEKRKREKEEERKEKDRCSRCDKRVQGHTINSGAPGCFASTNSQKEGRKERRKFTLACSLRVQVLCSLKFTKCPTGTFWLKLVAIVRRIAPEF